MEAAMLRQVRRAFVHRVYSPVASVDIMMRLAKGGTMASHLFSKGYGLVSI